MAEIMNTEDMVIISTEVEGSRGDDHIQITRKAIEEIIKVRQESNVPEDYVLRIATRGGGCSGMNYVMGFDSENYENDRVLKASDIDIIVDNKSLFYLMGITLDYTDSPEGKGFVFKNPNNFRTCGCQG